ncbi:MAG: hypothetical protein CMJ25_25205 [Phycisphaerae bacterium]|nr:hypothetical protein [Phycisphaerae bacterium]|tara:strand:+ start:2859 stop:3908 length:1050 start_codon:yes stop_codon:yes gene_type:complete
MSFIVPKKPQILYSPMLASFGGGSARGFNPGGGGEPFSGSFTFTNAAVTGNEGPSLADCRTAYASTAIGWDVNDTSQFNVTTDGYQDFKIPESGTYRFRVKGAKGGAGSNGNYGVGGEGVLITVDFILTEGSAIRVIVGQVGQNVATNGGGGAGGGTFVLYGTSITAFQQTTSYFQSNYIVAAGGGGSGTGLPNDPSANGVNGIATSDDGTASAGGNTNQGFNGDGGSTPSGTWVGGSGAGVETNGTRGKESGTSVGTEPKSYANGFLGAVPGPQYGGLGGFGGGASSGWGGGGGGGYSGGSGDSSVGSGSDKQGGGGGGTNYNTTLGASLVSRGNHADGNGSVFIEKL